MSNRHSSRSRVACSVPRCRSGVAGALRPPPRRAAAPTRRRRLPRRPAGRPPRGQIKLVVQRAFGKPPFVIAGERIVVRGIVDPVRRRPDGEGQLLPRRPQGRSQDGQRAADRQRRRAVQSASRAATPGSCRRARRTTRRRSRRPSRADSETSASPRPNLAQGDAGPSVRLLQSELNALHYRRAAERRVRRSDGRAVIAYRKMTGLARVPNTDLSVFERLQEGAGSFHVRYPQRRQPRRGRPDRQVLAEIEPGGRVRAIYTMSSGKPSTPTVIGRFQRVLEDARARTREGMVDSNYFIRGYAIHGYAEVPTYAASHGCLRVPDPRRAGDLRLGAARGRRSTSTTRAAAAATTSAATPVRSAPGRDAVRPRYEPLTRQISSRRPRDTPSSRSRRRPARAAGRRRGSAHSLLDPAVTPANGEVSCSEASSIALRTVLSLPAWSR